MDTVVRCTACDIKIQIEHNDDDDSDHDYRKSKVKSSVSKKISENFALSHENLTTLTRHLLKGRSSGQLSEFLTSEDQYQQLPICTECKSLIGQVHAFQMEMDRLTVLINEAINCVKAKFQESLAKSQGEDDESDVTRARKFFLGLRRGGLRSSKRPRKPSIRLRGSSSERSPPLKEVQPLPLSSIPCPAIPENDELSSEEPSEKIIIFPIASEQKVQKEEGLKSDVEVKQTEGVAIGRRKRKRIIKDYSKFLKGREQDDDSDNESESGGDNDWVIDEDDDPEPAERPRRGQRSSKSSVGKNNKNIKSENENPDDADEDSEAAVSSSKKKRQTDSRPRKTERRRLDIKETEPGSGVFEWKGIKFRWLDNGRIECGSCKKILKSKLCLIIHIRKIHLREGVGEFPCSVCGKSFERFESLKVHEDIHSERRHQCNYCGKLFHQQANLSHHLKSHGNELRHVCEFENCGKKFLTARQLRVHGKRHQGIKSFQCEFCSKMFIFRGELTSHLRSHAEELPFQCHLCDSKFFIKFRLRRHWRNVHKLDPDKVPEEYHQAIKTHGDHPLSNRSASVDQRTDEKSSSEDDNNASLESSSVKPAGPKSAQDPLIVDDAISVNSPGGSNSKGQTVGTGQEQVTILIKLL